MRTASHSRSLGLLFGVFGVFGVGIASAAAPVAMPQGPIGDPTLPPKGLTVMVVEVGQGDATIVVGPTGTALLFDAGAENAGRNHVIPALVRLGVKTVHFAIPSHYDTDHLGGMDEVIDNFPVSTTWDRGLASAPTHQAYKNYVKSAGQKRNTVQIGSSFVLGGGAKATVIAANGQVLGGTQYPIQGTNQFENASSIVLKVEYGDFSMWLGGDLTGGGNSTYDMESKVAKVCGNVDVYHVNHHGSNTSSNATALALLRPEVSLVSSGVKNPFGHPTTKVTNRINPANASSLFICTTAGANSWQGYGVGGDITLTTDGYRYRVEGQGSGAFDLYTDEVAATPVPPGTLRISELHRNPAKSEGEFIEIHCQGPGPVNLRGLRIQSNLGSVTIAPSYRLLPGDYLYFNMQGDAARNGGLPLGHTLPYRAISFGNSFDTIRLSLNGQTQDTLSFSNLAGGSGIAAERVNLAGGTTTTNFGAAKVLYGNSGDRGSPGFANSVDTTVYDPVAAMEVLPATAPGGRAIHMITTARGHLQRTHVMAFSLGNSPGMTLAGTHIPLNPDALFHTSLLLPGVIGTIPGNGRRGLRIQVPLVKGLQGLQAHFAHVITSSAGGPRPFPAASNAVRFVFP